MAENRALKKHLIIFTKPAGNCVFISHKKEDEAAANAIGKYLMEQVGVDIYLDTKDVTLQEAVSEDNDKKIVDSIRSGIETSTHLLCLVSDETRLSWWVPYEVGSAASKGKEIATLKLKNVVDIPSFLKTEQVIKTVNDFFNYTKTLEPFGGAVSNRTLSIWDKYTLSNYIDK